MLAQPIDTSMILRVELRIQYSQWNFGRVFYKNHQGPSAIANLRVPVQLQYSSYSTGRYRYAQKWRGARQGWICSRYTSVSRPYMYCTCFLLKLNISLGCISIASDFVRRCTGQEGRYSIQLNSTMAPFSLPARGRAGLTLLFQPTQLQAVASLAFFFFLFLSMGKGCGGLFG